MKPVIIIGAARSGTTFLARSALSNANSVCYWGEPNCVWMHGHAYRSDDVLQAEDATPQVKEYIQMRFERKLAEHGGLLILEKTPSNCLRIPFIRSVFPEARFVHLIRDGRSVIRSAVKEWQGTGHDAHDSKELRRGSRAERVGKGMKAYLKLKERIYNTRDLIELPSYAPRFINFVLRNGSQSGDYSWGPRFPGMKAFRKQHSLEETCAEQWRWQVENALDGLSDLPEERLFNMRFESLMGDPKATLDALINWLGIEMDSEVLDAIVSSVETRSDVAREDPLDWMVPESKAKVDDLMKPLLQRLGYVD